MGTDPIIRHTVVPLERNLGERYTFSFDQFRERGLLWLINRVVFHPRGLAVAFDYAEGEDQPRGWALYGYNEPVSFDPRTVDETALWTSAEACIRDAEVCGRIPPLNVVNEKTETMSDGLIRNGDLVCMPDTMDVVELALHSVLFEAFPAIFESERDALVDKLIVAMRNRGIFFRELRPSDDRTTRQYSSRGK